MKNRIRNPIPFFILFIIHSILFGFSIYKSKNKNRKLLFVLFSTNMGFAYLLEYVVLNLFKGYRYKPKVMKKNIFDNIVGAVLSQGIFLPFTAVFLTVINSGWKLKLLVGTYFSLIEELFLRLGVYHHYWWKTTYTFLLTPIYFKLSDDWYKWLYKRNPIVQFISFFFIIMITETNLFFILAIFRKVKFGFGRHHTWAEHFKILPLFSISFALFAAVIFRIKNNIIAKMVVVLFTVSCSRLLKRLKIAKSGFYGTEPLILRILMSGVYGKIGEWIYEESKHNENKDLINLDVDND